MTAPLLRIACFGDSLTEGYGLRPDEALPTVLEGMLQERGINASCLNFGVSGDTSGDGLARIQAVLNEHPAAIIIEFGANDSFVGEPVAVTRTNLSEIIETLQAHSIPILLVGITALNEFDDEYKTEFDALFVELSNKYEILLFEDILASYFGNSMMTLMDGMHPNAQGVEAIARDLLPYAIKLIQDS